MSPARRRVKVWSDVRSGTVILVALVALAALPLPFWPVSASVWMVLATAGLCWPRPENFEMESSGEQTAIKGRLLGRALINPSPRIHGFGSPGSNEEEQPASIWPPKRMSAWAAVVIALLVAVLEFVAAIPLAQFHKEGGPLYLWRHPAVSLLSIPFTFAIVQAASHVARMTTDRDSPAPAALWDPENWNETVSANARPGMIRGGVVAMIPAALAGPAVAAVVNWRFNATIPVVPLAAVTAFFALCVGFLTAARFYISLRLTDWKEQQENRRQWSLRWQTIPKVGMNPPQWVVDHDLPRDNPTHTVASFTIGVGGSFDMYEEAAPKLGPALGSDMILIVPLAALDEKGKTIPGTAQYGGFSVIWSHVKMGPKPHLRPELDPQTRKFAIRWAFTGAFKSLKLGRPEFVALTALHAPDSERMLIETQWRLASGTTFDQVAAKAHQLQEKLDAPWLRVGRRVSHGGESSEYVSIIYGDHPDSVKLRPPAAATKRLLDAMDWAAWFRASKLIGATGGVPQLEHKEINPRGIAEMEFQTAQGLSFPDVRKAIPAVSSSSGYAYVAAETLDESNRFRLVAGKVDPLNDAYLFHDYWDEAMPGPNPGRPKIDWLVGLGADGEPLSFTWDGEEPHLLVAGSSGSGKAQPLTSRIPVPVSAKYPTGWATIGDLREGDEVYTADGSVTDIIGLSEIVDDHDVYEVTFDDGSVVQATGSHLWKASSAATRSRDDQDRRSNAIRGDAINDALRTASDLRSFAATYPPEAGAAVTELAAVSGLDMVVVRTVIERMRLRSKSTYTTATEPEVGERRPGSSKQIVHFYPINEFLSGAADYLESLIELPGRQPLELLVTTAEMATQANEGWAVELPAPFDGPSVDLPVDPWTLGASLSDSPPQTGQAASDEELAELGVLAFTHIPPIYLRASYKQRLGLLQGLMDTDGTATANGRFKFSTVNERLANDTVELVRSLGIKASLGATPETANTDGHGWTVTFTTTEQVFDLSDRTSTSSVSTPQRRYVTAIERIDTVPARCLRIAHPSHLYLADGFVPTHNSGVINSFLCQLFYNNTPDDIEVWMMEPKNELQAYADIAHVKRFVDGQTPGDSPWANAAALLDEARQEMHRRYQLFSSHAQKPQKLSEARFIARQEGPPADGSRHPLDIPYLFVVIEECSNYFTPPSLKQFRTDWETVIYNVEEIARLARAAGIHLLVATQYPTNRTISPVLKQQCRRLGLKTNNQLASMVIIDEPGLEDIKVPGRGMMSYSKGYRGFRGFLMRRPDEDNPDAPDDRGEILSILPKVQGRVFGEAGTGGASEAPQPAAGIWDDEGVHA